MKKLYLILFTIFSVLFAISCTNDQKKITGAFEVLPEEPIIETNKNPDGTEELRVYYNLYTPYITVDNESKDIWKVESNDYEKLDKIWTSIITNFKGGMTTAFAPGYTSRRERRRAYFGYELNSKDRTTSYEDFSLYLANDSKSFVKHYKGTRIVRIPITNPKTGGAFQGKFTVAGIYTVKEEQGQYQDSLTQHVGSDEAILFRADLPFGGSKKGISYYAMQFLYSRAFGVVLPIQKDAKGFPYDDYANNKYSIQWAFANADGDFNTDETTSPNPPVVDPTPPTTPSKPTEPSKPLVTPNDRFQDVSINISAKGRTARTVFHLQFNNGIIDINNNDNYQVSIDYNNVEYSPNPHRREPFIINSGGKPSLSFDNILWTYKNGYNGSLNLKRIELTVRNIRVYNKVTGETISMNNSLKVIVNFQK